MSEEATPAPEVATVEVAGEIKELGDKIAELSLKQAVDLKDYLKDAYGLEPAAGGAVMVAGAGGGGEEEAEEQTAFDVILTSFGDKKIQVIKAVREVTGLGLKEAKELVDGAPKAVKEGVSKEDAQAAADKLKEQGAQVDIK